MANKTWPEHAVLPDGLVLTSFDQAVSMRRTSDPTTYNADIKRDWCIGLGKYHHSQSSPKPNTNKPLVPHGGYLASVISRATSTYIQDTHASLNQPDLITFHIEFLTRTALGPATIQLTPLKIGRQFSTFRAQLQQVDPKTSAPRTCLEVLITQGNLTVEAANDGLALATKPVLVMSPRSGFARQVEPPMWVSTRPAAFKLETWLPSGSDALGVGPQGQSVREQWVRWKGTVGGFLKVESLGFLTDAFRPVPENYGLEGKWYPTLSYGLDVKRRRNGADGKEVGWEWLYVRAEMTEARNGRFGIDVVVCDEEGSVICTSRHVALIVGSDRNVKGRGDTIAKI